MKPSLPIGEVLERIFGTRKKSTYYKRKYAIRAMLSLDIQKVVGEFEGAGDPVVGARLADLLDLAERMEFMGRACPVVDQIPRKSKRNDLTGLPSDWREKMLERMLESDNYVPALTAAVSGCRPEELKHGVRIWIEGDTLTLKIVGAKIGKESGQPERFIRYALPNKNGLVTDMSDLVKMAGGELDVAIKNPSSFTSAITYYGRMTFPRRHKSITPYCFRHAFASDIKKVVGDADLVSEALGHRSDRTRSRYGNSNIGRAGGVIPAEIGSTHEVRHSRSPGKMPEKETLDTGLA
ncbi:site-specific integrase [Methylomagnum ishizawai]|uniref:site-specific integrase n=1 Tax=Methylomagnum ishizawai TaxID=1760988 RepID=UPI000F73C033|nr:site-specific integrase [Methylomagnum ishizawai]